MDKKSKIEATHYDWFTMRRPRKIVLDSESAEKWKQTYINSYFKIQRIDLLNESTSSKDLIMSPRKRRNYLTSVEDTSSSAKKKKPTINLPQYTYSEPDSDFEEDIKLKKNTPISTWKVKSSADVEINNRGKNNNNLSSAIGVYKPKIKVNKIDTTMLQNPNAALFIQSVALKSNFDQTALIKTLIKKEEIKSVKLLKAETSEKPLIASILIKEEIKEEPEIASTPVEIAQNDVTTILKNNRSGIENVEQSTSRNINPISDNSTPNKDIETWNSLTIHLFNKIEKFIIECNHLSKLLTDQDLKLLQKFTNLKFDEYKYLCLKLHFRSKKWYNIFKLRTELKLQLSDPEVIHMYQHLSGSGFVEDDYSKEPCPELLSNLLKRDLKEICDSFKLRLRSRKKVKLIETLLTNCSTQTTLTSKSTEKVLRDRIKDKMGFCVKISSGLEKLFCKLHLLYTFTNSRDFTTLSDVYFFLSRIHDNTVILPNYQINSTLQIFSSESQFSRYLEAFQCDRIIQECWEKKQTDDMLKLCNLVFKELKQITQTKKETFNPHFLIRFTPGYMYTKALTFGAKHLGRTSSITVQEWLIFLIEQNYYGTHKLGSWYEMLILHYCHLKDYCNAVRLTIEALERKDLSEISYYELSARAEIIKHRKNKISELQHNNLCKVQKQPIFECKSIEIRACHIHENKTGKKRMYTEKTNDGQNIFTVEEVALNHYLTKGYEKGLHCESSLLLTILFVLFWDIIYDSSVPYSFVLEVQYFPLDLYCKQFYLNRQPKIDKRLEEIRITWSLDHLQEFIADMWCKHSHKKSFINNTIVDDPKDLYNIVLCIGRDQLNLILKRMIKDFRDYCSGLPDLFLWNVEQTKCKFVEVKGDNDKLSVKQRLWLSFLSESGLDAEICYVKTVGSKSKSRANVKK